MGCDGPGHPARGHPCKDPVFFKKSVGKRKEWQKIREKRLCHWACRIRGGIQKKVVRFKRNKKIDRNHFKNRQNFWR